MIETYGMEMIVPWIGVGPGPVDKLLRSNELLVEKVLPKLGIKLEQRKPTFRKELREGTWRDQPL